MTTIAKVWEPIEQRGRLPRHVLILTTLLALVGCTDPDPSGPDGGAAIDEEVTIPADGIDLVGTLRLPAGDPPYPAVVIAHGSGPQSRHGTTPGQLGLTLPDRVAVYDELAEGLQDRGYAVLAWDKRSCGPFNGCADNGYPQPPDDLTFDTFAGDVAAVLDHLAHRDDVSDLVVAGHSKGGTIAAQLAGDREDLAAVVLLASPAAPINEVLTTQAEMLAELVAAVGQEGPAVEAAVSELEGLAAEVAAIAAGDAEGPDVGGASRTFWASWIDASRRAPENVGTATVPVLALGGEHDWNVPPDEVRAWEPHLPPGSVVEILPHITHALTHLGTDDPAALTPADIGTSVDPSVIEVVGSWLDSTLDRS